MAKFQTLVEALQHWAEEKPHSSAIVFRDRHHQRHSLTWSQLYTLSGRFAAVLRTHAIARGTLVLNTLPNAMERVVCEAGIWMSGAASVNGRYLQSDGSDLLNIIRLSGCPVIVVDPDIEDGPWCVLKKYITLDDNNIDVVSSTLPCVRKVLFVRRVENRGPGDFLGGLQTQTQWFQAGDITPDDVLSVFTTSGTTGFSKLVIHSHQNLIGYLVGSVYAESFLKQPLQFNLTPLGWIGGALPLFIVPGVTRVACDVRAGMPDDMPRFIWRTIQEEKCRSGRFSPAYMPGVLKLAEEESQKSNPDSGQPSYWKLTTILLTGIPVNRSMVEAALTLAHKACVLYGATDAGTVAANIVTDSASFLDYDAGKPFKGIQVKIVHPRNEEEELPRNQVGDILIKIPHVMKGYLNDPKATAAAFTQGGFFRTGDMGRMDERGHLFTEGRGSDAIMRDDFVFHPSWMEQRVREFPGVAAVTIVGVPDPFLNEELCACVVLASDDVSLEDVRHFVENVVSPDNPSSPTPRYYLSFQSFPQTDTGKPKRKEIKLQTAQRLGLSLTKD